MSQTSSPITNKPYGLERVCKAWEVPRSTYYSQQQQRSNTEQNERKKPGPKPVVDDSELLSRIKQDIANSPFKGEGHRKVHARVKRQETKAGRNRVLKIMKAHNLLSPHRGIQAPQDPHDGTIITDAPNIMWCSDGTKIFTLEDGWVWVFSVEEHWNAECLGWNVCKHGDRFAALEPVIQAVKNIYGSSVKGIASGLKLRIDNGSQYTSDYFLKQIAYMGIEQSFGLLRQPQTNGVAERFNRTLKEQILDGRIFRNIEEVREAVRKFVEIYNAKWLLEKLGYLSPQEARQRYYSTRRAA
ncbi:MAG: IS3 family transposase [Rhabdochlamydiaceae bacterium]